MSEFKEWFVDKYPECKEYLELTYFDAEINLFIGKYSYNPDSIDAAWVLRVAFAAWQHQQAKVEELQKRVDEITNIATELAEYASYAEIVGGVTVNRSAVRNFCDKVFDFNRKVDQELEQALKGEGQ
ncbi:hypothetical protein [Acinetobacter baumannii]|uniref:hypothetical protein n=1 Tax=Acinetobacter baumannii TaxID=470 RepID=UPI0022226B1E|nr:hypothetical protein [Acinetobacter baumannii]MCW1497042.1 hypothetical protein [Acinetobacter baumannii]